MATPTRLADREAHPRGPRASLSETDDEEASSVPSEGQSALTALDQALAGRRMLLEAILRLLVAPGMLSVGMTPHEIKTLLEKYIVSVLKDEGLNPPAISDILTRSTRWVYRVQEAQEAPPDEPRETLREHILSTMASQYPRALTPADVHRRVQKAYARVEVETVRNLLLALRLEGWLLELRTPVLGFQTELAYKLRSFWLELDDVSGVERRNNLWESLPLLETLLTGYAAGSPDAGFGRLEIRLLETHLPELHERTGSAVRRIAQEFAERAREQDPDEKQTRAVVLGVLGFYRAS